MTFNIQGVEEENVLHHHELLPDAWMRVKSWHYDRLRYTLAKAWTCEDMVFAFSAWLVGRMAVSCTIEYDRTTNSCEVAVNTLLPFGLRYSVEETFAEALRMALGSPKTNYEDGTH